MSFIKFTELQQKFDVRGIHFAYIQNLLEVPIKNFKIFSQNHQKIDVKCNFPAESIMNNIFRLNVIYSGKVPTFFP